MIESDDSGSVCSESGSRSETDLPKPRPIADFRTKPFRRPRWSEAGDLSDSPAKDSER